MCKEQLKRKCTACKWVMLACFAVALGMLIGAFFTPPAAEIHPSILKGVAEVWAFAALAAGVMALTYGYDLHLQKGDTTLTINDGK